jgi:hypothetical protein
MSISSTPFFYFRKLRIVAPFCLGMQQRLDCAAFIHRAIALRYSFERQGQIKNLPRGRSSGSIRDQLTSAGIDARAQDRREDWTWLKNSWWRAKYVRKNGEITESARCAVLFVV